MCPTCSEAETKCVEVRVVGGHVAYLTFMEEVRVYVPPQTCSKQSLVYFPQSFTEIVSWLILTIH